MVVQGALAVQPGLQQYGRSHHVNHSPLVTGLYACLTQHVLRRNGCQAFIVGLHWHRKGVTHHLNLFECPLGRWTHRSVQGQRQTNHHDGGLEFVHDALDFAVVTSAIALAFQNHMRRGKETTRVALRYSYSLAAEIDTQRCTRGPS